MLSRYKDNLENKLTPLGKFFAGVHPNVFTVTGIIPYILFFFFMLSGRFGWSLVMLALSPLDLLDGLVARANHKTTAFGGLLDSTVDRISDFLMIAGLYAGHLASLGLTATLLVSSYLISYVRSRAEAAAAGKIKFDQGLIERSERIILIILAVMFHNSSLSHLLLLLLVILSVLTVGQRLYAAYQKL